MREHLEFAFMIDREFTYGRTAAGGRRRQKRNSDPQLAKKLDPPRPYLVGKEVHRFALKRIRARHVRPPLLCNDHKNAEMLAIGKQLQGRQEQRVRKNVRV